MRCEIDSSYEKMNMLAVNLELKSTLGIHGNYK